MPLADRDSLTALGATRTAALSQRRTDKKKKKEGKKVPLQRLNSPSVYGSVSL